MERQGNASTIKVFVRVRPMVATEKHTDRVTEVLPDNRTVRVVQDSYNHIEIKFDHAFPPDSDQEEVYQHFNRVIPRLLSGYNLTVFAYGQTGSGKTFTMFGRSEDEEKADSYQIKGSHRGVIPRAIEQIFDRVSGFKVANLFCSFLQVYNEKIYDLLQDTEKPKALGVHESKADGIFVEGLTEFGVTKTEDCLELLAQGIKNRIIRQTSMNAKSSRSHSIFQLVLEIQEEKGSFLKCRLNLCDLAGSEKINKKESMGELQMKELKNINLSLTTLGKVIYALSSGDRKVSGAFRQSKLTRLLQQSLTGNTNTFIMANLSPSAKNLEQTINTLKFVERANHITLKVKPTQITNRNPDTVVKLQRQIDYLKQLLDLKKNGLNPQMLPDQIKSLRKQNDYLKNQYIPKQSLNDIVKENRNMKKEIHNLQVRLEQTEGTESSLDSGYEERFGGAKKKKGQGQGQQPKQDILDKYKLDYYMPSSRGDNPSSRNSSDSKRVSSSLVQAGNSIAFPSNTIEESPNRQKEKKNLVSRLQDYEERKKNEELKLMEQHEIFQTRRGRYSPGRKEKEAGSPKVRASGKRQQSNAAKLRKKVDYSDKIKELEARLNRK